MITTFIVKMSSKELKQTVTLLVLAESSGQAKRFIYQNYGVNWLIDSVRETKDKVFVLRKGVLNYDPN